MLKAPQREHSACVLTSSTVAVNRLVSGTGGPDDWANPDQVGSYASKILAGRLPGASWRLKKATTPWSWWSQPGGVMDAASRASGTSTTMVSDMINGKMPMIPSTVGMVDVRDVAKVHVRALSVPEALGSAVLASEEPVEMCT